MSLQKNQIRRAQILGYTAEGLGVARIEGLAVFVHGAVRGDDCDVRILKVGANMAWGRVERLHTPSPHRVKPACPLAGRCGGCDLQHLSYEEEVWMKRTKVEDALARIGGLELKVEEFLAAPALEGYRNKAMFPLQTVDGRTRFGFFQKNSHRLIPADQCLIQDPASNFLAVALCAWMDRRHVSAYDEETGRGLVRQLFVRTNRQGAPLATLVVNGSALPHVESLVAALRTAVPELKGLVLNENTSRGNTLLGPNYRTLWGEDTLEDALCGLIFSLSPASFYQVNRDQAERLYARAGEYAALTGEDTLLDLYCGTGTITLALAGQAGRAVGVESVPRAVEDARGNARRNGVTNAEFFCGDAGTVSQELRARGLQPTVVTVDPPRKGLSSQAVSAVADLAPRRVVYVSCDPATLARDLKRFQALGYEAVRCTAVDLFPRTKHVEVVVLLTSYSDRQK